MKYPWFDFIKSKKKKIEGRLNKGIFSSLLQGDIIKFKNNDDFIKAKVLNIVKYNTFEEYLTQEGLKRTLPNIQTIDDGKNIYYQFYTPEQEKQYGILVIYIKVL